MTLIEREVQRIALGCLYVLLDKAAISYPNSNRAAPSDEVVVDSTADLLRDGDRVYFPFKVGWAIWQRGVVPVLAAYRLKKTSGTLRYQIRQSLVDACAFDRLLSEITQHLITSFKSAGFLSADPVVVPVVAQQEGEVVVRRNVRADGYDEVDVQVTLHPDGHQKKTYDEV